MKVDVNHWNAPLATFGGAAIGVAPGWGVSRLIGGVGSGLRSIRGGARKVGVASSGKARDTSAFSASGLPRLTGFWPVLGLSGIPFTFRRAAVGTATGKPGVVRPPPYVASAENTKGVAGEDGVSPKWKVKGSGEGVNWITDGVSIGLGTAGVNPGVGSISLTGAVILVGFFSMPVVQIRLIRGTNLVSSRIATGAWLGCIWSFLLIASRSVCSSRPRISTGHFNRLSNQHPIKISGEDATRLLLN